MSKGHQEYLQAKILTASKEQLVLMLYDGALRFCEVAVGALATKDLEGAHIALIKTQDIVLELLYSLDKEKGGELGKNMGRLYQYCYSRLIAANMDHKPEIVREVRGIISELRDAWVQAMENAGVSDSAEQAAPAQPIASAVTPATSTDSSPLAAPTPAPRPAFPFNAAPATGKTPVAPAAAKKSSTYTRSGKGVPLAKIPIVKKPATEIHADPKARPRFSAQG